MGESVRLPERFPQAAGNFTSSCFSIPIAASLALPATPPNWRTIFKYRKANSRQKRSPILGRRSPSTWLRSGRFPHCRVLGLYQASSTRWRPDLLRSSCRQRRFVLRKTPNYRANLTDEVLLRHDIKVESPEMGRLLPAPNRPSLGP